MATRSEDTRISEEYLRIMMELNNQYTPGYPPDVISFDRNPNYYEEREYGKHKIRVCIRQIMNPLNYAGLQQEAYIKNRMPKKIRVLFVGMNPSLHMPSGIPFGDKAAFLDFWGNETKSSGILEFSAVHQDKCVSGRRFWKFVKQCVGKGYYQENCFVINCCPWIFVGDRILLRPFVPPQLIGSGNVSLDNFEDPATHSFVKNLMQKSQNALSNAIKRMEPNLIVAIGWYAFTKVRNLGFEVRRVTHPSPANPEHRDYPNDPDHGDNMWISTIKHELKGIDWKALVKDKSGNN